jgi:hypothetical protein
MQLYSSHLVLSILEISLKPATVSCYSLQPACLNIISVLVNFAYTALTRGKDAFQPLLTSYFIQNVSELEKSISGGY